MKARTVHQVPTVSSITTKVDSVSSWQVEPKHFTSHFCIYNQETVPFTARTLKEFPKDDGADISALREGPNAQDGKPG